MRFDGVERCQLEACSTRQAIKSKLKRGQDRFEIIGGEQLDIQSRAASLWSHVFQKTQRATNFRQTRADCIASAIASFCGSGKFRIQCCTRFIVTE